MNMPMPPTLATIAYFSMEIGLEPGIPTYSGGLGILAGDTLRAAADLNIPIVGVSLVHRQGYFRQRLDPEGNQVEEPAPWQPQQQLEEQTARVHVELEGRLVMIRAWCYWIVSHRGGRVPVYLLDTDLPENTPEDRRLTDQLYGGDAHYRLCQEVILGTGGAAMLQALGYHSIITYHMNEGHSALLVLGLLRQLHGGRFPPQLTPELFEQVRQRCVFTTHTPVPAGHDQFPASLVRRVLQEPAASVVLQLDGNADDSLNMTGLALSFSRYVNGVALRHGEVSRDMFPGYPINSITNGVHAVTWTSPPFQALYDHHFPEWRHDNLYLRYAINLPPSDILTTHQASKQLLLDAVARCTGQALDIHTLTLGFARRATAYKRADLLFSDLERLRHIARQVGPLQILYAGKAHPRDDGGKAIIRKVFAAARALHPDVTVLYLEDYDMTWARLLCAGCDVWLNTPLKPQEASGTSGMKAALNGVPSLSVLDGWWVEGCIEGVTGWAIGEDGRRPSDPDREAASLYDKLEHVVLPLYYKRPLAFAEICRAAIALNGAYYNAQRMMMQYLTNAYAPSGALDNVLCPAVPPPATTLPPAQR
jgi:starch phosphorylase